VARQHPLRPLSARPRRPRQLGVPLPRRRRHAGHDPQARRLRDGRLRERVPARLAVRARPRVRRLRRPAGRSGSTHRVPDAGEAGGADGGGGPEVARRAGTGPDVHVDPPLRAALPLCPARAVRLALCGLAVSRRSGLHGQPARARPGAAPPRGKGGPHAGRLHQRPRRRPRRARREDPRHLRVRDDAARALDPVRSAALRTARRGTARAARGHPADGARCPRPGGSTRCDGAQPARARLRWAPLTGLAQDRFKLIDLPIPELYDLDADPHETRNLAATETRTLDAIRAQLARLRGGDRGTARGPEDAETRERLRSLGYASATAPAKARYTEDDDPKRLIGLDTAIQDVVTLYQGG